MRLVVIDGWPNAPIPYYNVASGFADGWMSMRIALVSSGAGGKDPWERAAAGLADRLVRKEIDATVFPVGSPERRESLQLSEVLERAEEFDLIHNFYDCIVLTYLGKTTTPVLTTVHELLSPLTLPVYEKYNPRSYYASVSEAGRSEKLGYIATVYPGIDPGQLAFRPEPGDYLLRLGRIGPGRGIEEAVQTAEKAGRKLILSGVVQDADYFASRVKPRLDGRRIVFRDPAGGGGEPELLGGAIALLHTAQVDEPFPLTAIEAMACGTPVVAWNGGGMPELIAEGKTGFLVSAVDEAVDALRRVRRLDRAECRRFVEERFSADRMAADYLRVYEKILTLRKREDHRPWGYYEVLSDETTHKVKRIVVYPGGRLSLQRHHFRSEHWFIVQGSALATKGDDEIPLQSGRSIDIPVMTWHRVKNTGGENLIFVETQTGSYLGEDDIDRREDDYGRA
jgi:mannose-6-phosphate isomerase-like protein (cupin superfamily)